jgi:hypothetical protein
MGTDLLAGSSQATPGGISSDQSEIVKLNEAFVLATIDRVVD